MFHGQAGAERTAVYPVRYNHYVKNRLSNSTPTSLMKCADKKVRCGRTTDKGSGIDTTISDSGLMRWCISTIIDSGVLLCMQEGEASL